MPLRRCRLAIITIITMFSGGAEQETGLLLPASLALSLLSMAYGFFGTAQLAAKHKLLGRRFRFFLCVLLDLTWTLFAVGVSIAKFGTGGYIMLGVLFAPGVLLVTGLHIHEVIKDPCYTNVPGLEEPKAPGALRRNAVRKLLAVGVRHIIWPGIGGAFAAGIISMAVDGIVISGNAQSETGCRAIVLPLYRRCALLAGAVGAVITDWRASPEGRLDWWLAGSLVILQILDLLASSHMLVIVGALRPKFDPLSRLTGSVTHESLSAKAAPIVAPASPPTSALEAVVPAAPAAAPPATAELPAAQATTATAAPSILRLKTRVQDMLGAVCMGGGGKTAVDAPDGFDKLGQRCTQLLDELTNTDKREAELQMMEAALQAYLPSDNGETEWVLLRALETEDDRGVPLEVMDATAASGGVKQAGYVQEMRAIPLAAALELGLWLTKPSFFGRRVTGTNYDKSIAVPRASYFISHAWNDDSEHKVEMLQYFLCVHDLLGRAGITLTILALFFFPLGLAIASEVPGFPVWLPSIILWGLLFLLVLWVWLATTCSSGVPVKARPWSWSRQTLWLDKCCINQATPETVQSGVSRFDYFLGCCDGMVAFVSPAYFSRLWCVYELAMFCRKHTKTADMPTQHFSGLRRCNTLSERMHQEREKAAKQQGGTVGVELEGLEGKLLLLGLDWPSVTSPFKKTAVSHDELQSLRSFRCTEALCFKPSDRAYVLDAIRREWGSVEVFDTFVQEKLPHVLAQSKHNYSTRMLEVALHNLDLLFGD